MSSLVLASPILLSLPVFLPGLDCVLPATAGSVRVLVGVAGVEVVLPSAFGGLPR